MAIISGVSENQQSSAQWRSSWRSMAKHGAASAWHGIAKAYGVTYQQQRSVAAWRNRKKSKA